MYSDTGQKLKISSPLLRLGIVLLGVSALLLISGCVSTRLPGLREGGSPQEGARSLEAPPHLTRLSASGIDAVQLEIETTPEDILNMFFADDMDDRSLNMIRRYFQRLVIAFPRRGMLPGEGPVIYAGHSIPWWILRWQLKKNGFEKLRFHGPGGRVTRFVMPSQGMGSTSLVKINRGTIAITLGTPLNASPGELLAEQERIASLYSIITERSGKSETVAPSGDDKSQYSEIAEKPGAAEDSDMPGVSDIVREDQFLFAGFSSPSPMGGAGGAGASPASLFGFISLDPGLLDSLWIGLHEKGDLLGMNILVETGGENRARALNGVLRLLLLRQLRGTLPGLDEEEYRELIRMERRGTSLIIIDYPLSSRMLLN